MLKKILIVVVVLLVVLVAVIATRPAEFTVTRSAKIAAAPAVVFPLVNDFHAWADWSPWDSMDPGMKKTYSGAAAGAGATYEWSGNDKVGMGRMTILESKPDERVNIRLEFIKPFAATSETSFDLKPEGANGTDVTWSMTGHNNFMAKAMSLFMNMDKMIGPDFEKGLAAMKSKAEKAASAPGGGAMTSTSAGTPSAAGAPSPSAPPK